jgi:hypothetical protein
METNKKIYSRRTSLVSSFAFWVAALLIAALIGGLSSVRVGDSSRKAMLLVALLALIAVIGITWRQSRANARRRLQAAWAAYAEREISQQRRRTVRLAKNAD